MARDFTKNVSNKMSIGTSVIGPLYSGASAVSCAAWIQFDTTTSVGTDNIIFISRVNGAGSGLALNIIGTTNVLRLGGRSASADAFQSVSGSTALQASRTYHVGGVFDFARGLARVYIDGVLDATGSVTFGSTTYSHGTPTALDAVGSDNDLSNTPPYFDGRISEIGVWRDDIGDAGFRQLGMRKLAPHLVRRDVLVFHMPLQGIASPEPDIRSGLVGTITGTIAACEHPPISYQLPFSSIRKRRKSGLLNRRRRVAA